MRAWCLHTVSRLSFSGVKSEGGPGDVRSDGGVVGGWGGVCVQMQSGKQEAYQTSFGAGSLAEASLNSEKKASERRQAVHRKKGGRCGAREVRQESWRCG